MEALAILSHLLHYVLAVIAVTICLRLYRPQRQWGWLFLSAIFLEPFVLLVMRVLNGRPLMPYKVVNHGADLIMNVTYRYNFPFLYLLALVGLVLLFRQTRGK